MSILLHKTKEEKYHKFKDKLLDIGLVEGSNNTLKSIVPIEDKDYHTEVITLNEEGVDPIKTVVYTFKTINGLDLSQLLVGYEVQGYFDYRFNQLFIPDPELEESELEKVKEVIEELAEERKEEMEQDKLQDLELEKVFEPSAIKKEEPIEEDFLEYQPIIPVPIARKVFEEDIKLTFNLIVKDIETNIIVKSVVIPFYQHLFKVKPVDKKLKEELLFELLPSVYQKVIKTPSMLNGKIKYSTINQEVEVLGKKMEEVEGLDSIADLQPDVVIKGMGYRLENLYKIEKVNTKKKVLEYKGVYLQVTANKNFIVYVPVNLGFCTRMKLLYLSELHRNKGKAKTKNTTKIQEIITKLPYLVR